MLTAFFSRNPDHVSKQLDSQDADWFELVEEGARELVLPALSEQARRLQIASRIPLEILDVFNVTEALNGERNKEILSEAFHLTRLLNRIGIQPVALKGLAYLLTDVYPNPASRYLLDIDLLVPAPLLPRAVAHLLDNGYAETSGCRSDYVRHHHPPINRAGHPTIELHERVGLGVCERLLPATDIFHRAQPLTAQGATLLIPDPSHLVTHLILHSQLLHPYPQRIFPPVRAIHDLRLLQTRFGVSIDWNAIADAYSQAGELGTLALHLKHARHFYDIEVPEFALTPLREIRWQRRLLLNQHRWLRFADPSYFLLALFSRRVLFLPQLLRNRKSWPQVLRLLISPDFYQRLFAV